MKCNRDGFADRYVAMDQAESSSMIVNDNPCHMCGKWHLRDAASEAEADEAGRQYRAALVEKFPALRESRGWK